MIIHGEAAFVLWPDFPAVYGSCSGKSMSIEISSEKHGKKQLTMVDGFGIIIKLSHERH